MTTDPNPNETAANPESAEKETRRRLWERLSADPEGYEANREFGLYCVRWRNLILLAEPYLKKALSGRPDDSDAEPLLMALAEVYRTAGRFGAAAEIHAELAERKPAVVNHHFHLGDCLFSTGDMAGASQAYRRGAEMLEILAGKVKIANGGHDRRVLMPYVAIHRYFGETAHKLDLFVKARALGLVPDFEAVVLAPEGATANMALMRCFAPHVTLVTEPDRIDAILNDADHTAWFHLDSLGLPNGTHVHREMAYGVVQRLWSDRDAPPLATLPGDIRAHGEAWLRAAGIPADAWFATLHVREPGYHAERVAWDHNRLRNGDIAAHVPAIEAITAAGGRVVRLGDPSMAPLPPMPGVIDYAHRPDRDPRLDVFLIARSRFFVGLSSGPMNVARAFGVPVAAVNYFPAGAWPFGADDVFIHKLHRSVTDGRYLSMSETLAPPLFAAFMPMVYEERGVEVVDNDAEDIRDAVREMIDRVEGRHAYSDAEDALQRRYRRVADPFGFGFLLPVAKAFLARHSNLIDDDGGAR